MRQFTRGEKKDITILRTCLVISGSTNSDNEDASSKEEEAWEIGDIIWMVPLNLM